MTQSRAAVPGDEPKSVDQTERLKSRLEAERQSTRVRSSTGAPPAMADAASPSRLAESKASMDRVSEQPAAPPAAEAAAKDLAGKHEAAASMNDSTNEQRSAASAQGIRITGRVTDQVGEPIASASVVLEGTGIGALTHDDGSYELHVPPASANGQMKSLLARRIGHEPATVIISLWSAEPITRDFVLATKRLALNEVVVTGQGVTSTTKKLDTVADANAPTLVSKSTSTEGADTVVTTVYAVHGDTVTLIDRSSARPQPSQQLAKAREDSRINSITWSDSAGRTRTLRGTVSREELERVRTALFGATP